MARLFESLKRSSLHHSSCINSCDEIVLICFFELTQLDGGIIFLTLIVCILGQQPGNS